MSVMKMFWLGARVPLLRRGELVMMFDWLGRGEQDGTRFGCTTDRLVERFSGMDIVPPN